MPGCATRRPSRRRGRPASRRCWARRASATWACCWPARNDPGVVLSLDFRGETFQGPSVILATPALWPARVIAMTLAAVGAGAGPDMARLAEVLRRAEGRAVYAAGGVRDAADLRRLADLGAAGALVASALHAGTLGSDELAAMAG